VAAKYVDTVPPLLEFERFEDRSVGAYGAITPTVGGFFFVGMQPMGEVSTAQNISIELFSDAAPAWRGVRMYIGGEYGFAFGIGDGSNFRVKNWDDVARTITLMRAGYSRPNPPPKVGSIVKGSLVLEVSEKYYVSVDVHDLENVVREGKTLERLIEEDAEDKMGYGKYLDVLHGAGYCMGRMR